MEENFGSKNGPKSRIDAKNNWSYENQVMEVKLIKNYIEFVRSQYIIIFHVLN